MTTIACDGKSMASDGRSTDEGGLICSESVVKVRRLKDGRIFGLSGTPFDLDNIERWFNEGGEFPEVGEQFDVLLLDKDGCVYCYDRKGDCTEEMLPAAIGSGCELAIGAMEAGATPAEAVRIACKRHNGSGGKITVLSL
jgi:ATP-dependent protease HslVU (ClpYQ) peptidase subunit